MVVYQPGKNRRAAQVDCLNGSACACFDLRFRSDGDDPVALNQNRDVVARDVGFAIDQVRSPDEIPRRGAVARGLRQPCRAGDEREKADCGVNKVVHAAFDAARL